MSVRPKVKDFIRNLVATNIVMEGIWFTVFMVALSFRQRKQLRNFGSMINWVLRDESLHLQFGMNLIQNILEENLICLQVFADDIRNIIIEGVDCEVLYNKDLFPNGILGLNADYVNQYVKYVADRRLEELGFSNTTMLPTLQNGCRLPPTCMNWSTSLKLKTPATKWIHTHIVRKPIPRQKLKLRSPLNNIHFFLKIG